MPLSGTRPQWLTFDCYGTLIQWDEGILAFVRDLLARKGRPDFDPAVFLAVYDRHEHRLEQTPPHRTFKAVSDASLHLTMEELGLGFDSGDAAGLHRRIPAMPPFPEVVGALARLKTWGFGTCIVSNTDDDVIAGNAAQLGGHIDRVITAERAGAYKPDPRLFEYAHRALGAERGEVLHVCASPHLDLVAARDMGFRCVWIDRGTGRTAPDDYSPDAVLPDLGGLPDLIRAAGWA